MGIVPQGTPTALEGVLVGDGRAGPMVGTLLRSSAGDQPIPHPNAGGKFGRSNAGSDPVPHSRCPPVRPHKHRKKTGLLTPTPEVTPSPRDKRRLRPRSQRPN